MPPEPPGDTPAPGTPVSPPLHVHTSPSPVTHVVMSPEPPEDTLASGTPVSPLLHVYTSPSPVTHGVTSPEHPGDTKDFTYLQAGKQIPKAKGLLTASLHTTERTLTPNPVS